MALVGFELLVRLFLGSFFCLLFVSRVETSEKFVKIAFRIGTGFVLSAVLLAFSIGRDGPLWPATLLASAWLGFFFYVHFLRGPWRAIGALLLLLAIGGLGFRDRGFLSFVEFFGSSLLLGSIYMGQFLGHWFLNVPGMNIREMVRIVKILLFALGLRTFTNLWTLLFAGALSGASGDALLLYGIRAVWGLIPLYVLAYMIYKTTVIRSTQSATGIYYAASVMVLVGETMAIYLKMNLNWLV
jgi:hypothetical protein